MRRAERGALRECGHDCQIVVRIESGCGAYAADQTHGSTIFGYAFAKTGEGAQRRAMGFCREYGGRRCQVRPSACISRQRRMAAWLPPSRTGGTGRPSHCPACQKTDFYRIKKKNI